MFKLFILAALVAVALTAPALNTNESNGKGLLQRPSPINPDVPMAPKPAEKTTKITDPKEIAKYKREVNGKALKAFLPTVTPDVPQQQEVSAARKLQPIKEQREKRDVEETGASLASVPTIYHDHDHALQTQQSTKDKTEDESTADAAPPAAEHDMPAKRDIPVPLVAKHQHDEETKPTTSTTETSTSDVHSTTLRHETTTEHKSAKRDAVPSHEHHEQHDDGKKEHHDQVQVEDLSEHHTNANKKPAENGNHKRDTVPSHEHHEHHDDGKKEHHDQVQVEDLSEHHTNVNKKPVENGNHKRDAVQSHSHEHHDADKKEPHDQVQVEDLSEHHVNANKKHDEKSNNNNNNGTPTDHIAPIAAPLHASSEHPAIIKHPIPVAELFAQHH